MATNEGSHRVDPTRDRDRPDESEQQQARRVDHFDRVAQDTQSVPATEQRVLPARTSAGAVFSLIFGLSALLAVLTIILAPLALALSIIGIILGVIGMKKATRVGVTGRGVAIGALVLAVIALLLSITVVAGVTTVLNNKNALERLDKQVQKLKDNLPAKVTNPTK